MFEKLHDCLCLGLDGAGGSFLYEDVTVLAMLKGEEDEVNCFFERHDETGHLGFGQGDGVAFANLVNPQRNHTAARTHHIAITCAANLCVTTQTALGYGYLLLDGLGDAHRVDGIGCLIGGEADDALHTCIDGGIEGVVCADDVGLDGFHGEELAAGHLLEGSGMKDVVHSLHCIVKRTLIAYVTDIELYLACHLGHTCLKVVTHVVLLLLVAGEDADFADVGLEEAVENCVAEAAGASCDEEDFVFK